MKIKALKLTYWLCCAIVIFLAFKTGFAFQKRLGEWWSLAGIMDWPIFIDHSLHYIKSGELYQQNIGRYGPAEPIYKFPPLFASILIGLLDKSITAEVLTVKFSILQIALYFFSAVAFLICIARNQKVVVYALAGIFLFTFEPFFDVFVRLQLESCVLFLLVAGICFLVHRQELKSGFCFGFATGLKIYPALFCIIFIPYKNYRALAGAAVGFFTTIFISLFFVDSQDHYYYFFKIVPYMISEIPLASNENISIANFMMNAGFSIKSGSAASSLVLLTSILIVLYGGAKTSSIVWSSNQHRDASWLISAGALSVLITGFLLGTKNSWWHYQILLVIPVLVAIVSLFDRRYFSWVVLFSFLLGLVFIYYGCLMKLDFARAWSKELVNGSDIFDPVFVSSVYLRGMANILCYVGAIWLYYRMVRTQTRQLQA